MGNRIQEGLRILMVDDTPEDTFFVQRALGKSGLDHFFCSVHNGAEGIAYLRGEGKYADRTRFLFPNILFLDLKMPGVDGFDVLRWLRDHPECKVIPTIGFTSSSLNSDVQKFYELGGNAFLTKPGGMDELVELIRFAYDFWSRCQTPDPPPGEKCQ